MTRETKIGLLVGLAFIIMVGILLTNQFPNDPPARVSIVADNVRDSVTGVGGTRSDNTPITAPSVTPTQTVPTADDIQHAPPRTMLRIGPGNTTHLPTPLPVAAQPTSPAQPSGPIVITSPAQPTLSQSPTVIGLETPIRTASAEDALHRAAREHGEELVLTGHQPQPTGPAASSLTQIPAGTKQYQAQTGDSLSRIAARFYGSDSQSARQTLIHANPSLADHPDRIILGKTYIIPATVVDADAAPAAPAPAVVGTPAPMPTPLAAAPDPDHVYIVKKGDTLWAIASQQLGTPSARAAIQDLNQDILKGSDKVREGMKLRMPAKPLASAN